MALLNFIGLPDELFNRPGEPHDRAWLAAPPVDFPVEREEIEVDLGCLICFDPNTCPHVDARPVLPPMNPPPESFLPAEDRIDLAFTRLRHEFGTLEHSIRAAGRVGATSGTPNRQTQLMIATAFADRALALCSLLASLKRDGK